MRGQNNFIFGLCLYNYFYSIFLTILLHYIYKKVGGISYNVPAVYDVFASPIKKTEGFQGLQKCGWS
jgi:hypothetical protein